MALLLFLIFSPMLCTIRRTIPIAIHSTSCWPIRSFTATATPTTSTAPPAMSACRFGRATNLVDWQAARPGISALPANAGPATFSGPRNCSSTMASFICTSPRQGGDPPLRRIVLAEGDSPLGPFHESKPRGSTPARASSTAMCFETMTANSIFTAFIPARNSIKSFRCKSACSMRN